MRYLKYVILLAAVLAVPSVHSQAQVAIGVQIGPTYGIYNAPPVCEWGFYPTYPFGCAPYGYYGPEWFVDGVFIGAGPWANFYYARPAYYRPYYFRSVWYVNRFHDRDRFIFRDRGFGNFREHEFRGHDFDRGGRFDHDRGFDRGRDFDRGRGFDHDRGFDRGRGFDRDRGFDRGREFRGGDRGFRGGESHGGGNRGGGESHAGNRGWRR